MEECVAGLCCDLTDLSEVIAVLDMFVDSATPDCPAGCPPGACELPAPQSCCRDASYFDGSADHQGTTLADCCNLNGLYLGDGTTCAASALPTCP